MARHKEIQIKKRAERKRELVNWSIVDARAAEVLTRSRLSAENIKNEIAM
jgi:hypothetical protein